MPGTGSYSGGSASADYRFSAPELLSEIPDNNAQLIQAKNVRDSVWTLWNRIDDVQITASQAASQSAIYSNADPMPSDVGGLTAGTTFSAISMSDIFDVLFYPYIDPTIQFSMSPLEKEYGASCNISLTYSLRPGTSNPVSSITVDGTGVVPSGAYQTGTIAHTTATHSGAPGATTSNTFTMSVTYGSPAVTEYRTTELIWRHRWYVGSIDLSGAPTFNPNLTLDQSALTLAAVAAGCTDSVIKLLINGEFVPDSGFNGLEENGLGSIYTDDEYFIFAFPTYLGTPDIYVDGNIDTAFTKVRSNSTFVNASGFSSAYDVWVSNTQRNGTASYTALPAKNGTQSNTGTPISSAIRPYRSSDPIATAYSSEIKGGHHSYGTIAERDAIIEPRREWGMMATIYNDGTDNGIYTLTYDFINTDIMDNANWVVLNNGEINTKYYIAPSESITVPSFAEYFIYGDLEIAGELINYGKVVVLNGAFSLTGSGTFSNFGEIDIIEIGEPIIDTNQIAFGTGAGITSSNNLMFYGTCNSSIFGGTGNSITATLSQNMGIIAGELNTISDASSCHSHRSTIIGGFCNTIGKSENSSIIGGTGSTIATSSNCSSIIGGSRNMVASRSFNSSILGGCGNLLSCSIDSSIIGGKGSTIATSSNYSSIIGGNNNILSCAIRSSIIGGCCNQLSGCAINSSIIGGRSNTSIDHSHDSFILGGSSNQLSYSQNSAIINSRASVIATASSYSSIIGGVGQEIRDSESSVIMGGDGNVACCSPDSAIIAGHTNILCNSHHSAIVGGIYGRIGEDSLATRSNYSSIIGGSCNTISASSSNSSIIGGCFNILTNCSINSSIIGGNFGTISCSKNSAIIGGTKQTLFNTDNAVLVPSLFISGSVSSIIGGVTFSGVTITFSTGDSRVVTIKNGILTSIV